MFGQNSILLNSTNRAIELGPIVNIYLIGNLVQWEKKVQWLAGGLVAQIFILWSQGKGDSFLYLRIIICIIIQNKYTHTIVGVRIYDWRNDRSCYFD